MVICFGFFRFGIDSDDFCRFTDVMTLPHTNSVKAKKAVETKRKLQKRNPEVTRQALIAAGELLFAKHGYSDTTLDMLAKQSSVNSALVSYYFGSKAGLYDAVFETIVADVVAAISQQVDSQGDPESQFRAYLRAMGRAFYSRPTFPAILMSEYINGSMQHRQKPFDQLLQFFRITERIYRYGNNAGAFKAMDIHQLHLAIVGPLVHFVVTVRFRKETFNRLNDEIHDPTIDEFTDSLSNLLLGGLT